MLKKSHGNKWLITIILTTGLLLRVNAQDFPIKDGKVFYELVDSLKFSQDQLYDRAKLWMAEAFRDSKEVIQLEDKGAGILVGKGAYAFTHNLVPYYIRFTIKINTKENKYRLQIYDLLAGWNNTNNPLPIEKWIDKKSAKAWLKKTDEGISDIIKNFEKKMTKTPDNDF